MARTSRAGRKSAQPSKPAAKKRASLLDGLPKWVQTHARTARRGAKLPLDVVRRWGGMLDGVLGEYLSRVDGDMVLEGGPDWEGIARTITPLAEARRKMAATEAELTPRNADGGHITHDLGDGPGMWQGSSTGGILEVTGDEPDGE